MFTGLGMAAAGLILVWDGQWLGWPLAACGAGLAIWRARAGWLKMRPKARPPEEQP